MSFVVYQNKYVTSGGKLASSVSLPSEAPALSMLQNFRTGMGAFFAEEDRLPVSQAELEPFVDFSPSGVYTFAYYFVDTSLGYCNAQSSNAQIHSFTMTVSLAMGLDDITCQKLGTTPPGVADYIGGVLSCQIGTEEV